MSSRFKKIAYEEKKQKESKPIEVSIKDQMKKIYSTFTENDAGKSFRYSNIALYSVTFYKPAAEMAKIFLSIYTTDELKGKTITEGFACIGGNTAAFARIFGKVNSCEMSDLHFELLKHNMSILNLNNITYYIGNYYSYIGKIKQDIVFLDPPWTSPSGETITLEYQGKNYTMLDTCNILKGVEIIMLKLPERFSQELKLDGYTTIKFACRNSNFDFRRKSANNIVFKIILLVRNDIIGKISDKKINDIYYQHNPSRDIIYDVIRK